VFGGVELLLGLWSSLDSYYMIEFPLVKISSDARLLFGRLKANEMFTFFFRDEKQKTIIGLSTLLDTLISYAASNTRLTRLILMIHI
jgi:hypothetical protein